MECEYINEQFVACSDVGKIRYTGDSSIEVNVGGVIVSMSPGDHIAKKDDGTIFVKRADDREEFIANNT